MHYPLKLIQIGNSIGVTLPNEVLARLKLEKGGLLFLTEVPEGYQVTDCDPCVAEQLELGRSIMCEFRDTLRALAK